MTWEPRVFVWTANFDGKRCGPVASPQAAHEYAREELQPGDAYELEQWEVGFPRLCPTTTHHVVPQPEETAT
jgi:hypothetical protein